MSQIGFGAYLLTIGIYLEGLSCWPDSKDA